MLIILTQPAQGGKGFYAWPQSNPDMKGFAESRPEAVGKLIEVHGESFGIFVMVGGAETPKTAEGIILVRKNPTGGFHASAEEDSTKWAVSGTKESAIAALEEKHSELKGRDVQIVPS
jgi:hypothetical protein